MINLTDVYTRIYTEIEVITMVYTKVFISGNSQAVRIPKEYHINESELAIKKIGTTIILFPKSSPWAHLEQGVAEFTPDYMADSRNQPEMQEREGF